MAGRITKSEQQLRLARGRGCPGCFDSGYKSRLAIHEILEVDAELQRLVITNPSRNDLDAYIEQHDVRTLLHDGVQRALDGHTTVEEVLRVVNS